MDKLNAYQQQQVLTSSPQKLVILLYNKAIIQLKLAKSKESWTEKSVHFKNTEEILIQLMRGCDRSLQLGQDLYNSYDFYIRYLLLGQIRKEEQRIDNAIRFLEQLRDVLQESVLKAAEES